MINLVFDIDDTLYDQLKPFEDAFQAVFKSEINISCADLYKKSRKYSDEVFHLTEDGSLYLEDMHVYRISKAFLDLGKTITRDEAKAFQNKYALNQGKITVSDGIIEVLDHCK